MIALQNEMVYLVELAGHAKSATDFLVEEQRQTRSGLLHKAHQAAKTDPEEAVRLYQQADQVTLYADGGRLDSMIKAINKLNELLPVLSCAVNALEIVTQRE
jgi:hypothetical protein